jgi:hypothetical protein
MTMATALVDTGQHDDIIFEEFKGTGNAESTLIASWWTRRVFPAIDILKSGTRKEGPPARDDLNRIWVLRKVSIRCRRTRRDAPRQTRQNQVERRVPGGDAENGVAKRWPISRSVRTVRIWSKATT